MNSVRVLLIGAGAGSSYFLAGLEKIKSKEVEPLFDLLIGAIAIYGIVRLLAALRAER